MNFYVKADGAIRKFSSDCKANLGVIELVKVDIALELAKMKAKKFGPILAVVK